MRYSLILLILGIIVWAFAGCQNSNDYHEVMMKKAYDAMRVKPEQHGGLTAHSIDQTQRKRFEKHRDTLIERGFSFGNCTFSIRLDRPPSKQNALLKSLLQSPPYPIVDFVSPHTDQSQPLQIILWGSRSDKEGWDRFMSSHDTPPQANQQAVKL